VGIESGIWAVLYLQRTDFPYRRRVNMRGRHAVVMIQMSQQARATLRGWLQREMSPLGQAKCARAMVLLEQCHSYTHTARWVSLTERNLRKWAKRFRGRGLAGLDNTPRPGRTPVFSPEVALYPVKLACERPDDRGSSLSQWNGSELARPRSKPMASSRPFPPPTVDRILRLSMPLFHSQPGLNVVYFVGGPKRI
jgi:hypothetical protein